MIIKLNVVDRKRKTSHFFYDTIECLLLDDKGYPVLDIESHPYKSSELAVMEDPYWSGAEMIEQLKGESEILQRGFCTRQIHLFSMGIGLDAPRHRSKFNYFMDNFIVVPSPKHYMGWLGIKNAEFYYNLPYFVVAILALTGKLVTSLEQEEVEPVYKSSL